MTPTKNTEIYCHPNRKNRQSENNKQVKKNRHSERNKAHKGYDKTTSQGTNYIDLKKKAEECTEFVKRNHLDAIIKRRKEA